MKKFKDKDIFKRIAKLEGKQSRKVTTFIEFQRQFAEYKQAKTGKQVRSKFVCRPHVDIFNQPQRRRKS